MPDKILTDALIEAYRFINQTQATHECKDLSESKYWDWKRGQVCEILRRAMRANRIDWREQQDQE